MNELSNTLKRRQQKRHEATKLVQEGLSSLQLSSDSNPHDSYLLDEGDQRVVLAPNSYLNPDFKRTIDVLLIWINSSLKQDSIIVRSLEDDVYDGYILSKLIQVYQPNIRLLENDLPLSEQAKKQTLRKVLDYLDICLNQSIKWTFEQIYNRDLIAILHLLLAMRQHFEKISDLYLPKSLILKVICVEKRNEILQTRFIDETFIDSIHKPKYGDLIDTLFDLAPEKVPQLEMNLVKFCNSNLNRYQIHIKQILVEDFQNGLYLLYLLSHLENYCPIFNKFHRKQPINREQSHVNLQLVFQLMKQGKIIYNCVCIRINLFDILAGIDIEDYCQINDILDGDQRTLYRLLFQIYLKYNSDSTNLLQSIRTHIDSPFL